MVEVIPIVLAVVVGVGVVMRMDVEPREVLTPHPAGEPSAAGVVPTGSEAHQD